MSLLECMSYGVVPVITPVGSIPAVVTEGQNGILIKVKDTQSIVDAITYLHTHKDKLEQMSKSSRHFIYEHFDADYYIDKLNNIYNVISTQNAKYSLLTNRIEQDSRRQGAHQYYQRTLL